MKILVACEESQAVTIELRKLGHEAYSCDVEPCSGGHPEWHIQQYVEPLLKQKWDMIIAFPPCTHLAVSGAAWFEKKRETGEQREGIEFFAKFLTCDCERVAIENPVGIIGGEYITKHCPELAEKYGFPIKPTQIIHPWQFGHPEKKSTCLWIRGMEPLKPTNDVSEYMKTLPKNEQERLHYLPPSRDRAKLRSKTFPGVAKAMATQWAGSNSSN